jgi:hypothetical protein
VYVLVVEDGLKKLIMPYIKKEERVQFQTALNYLAQNIETDGDLNYCMSFLIHKILEKRGVNYQNMNNLVGSLECAKNEFIRTIMSPYEDKKRLENGNVSNLDKV